jgi:predicted heme/steroid binding protein
MEERTKTFAFIALLVTVALLATVAAGCGGGKTTTTEPTTPTTSTTPTSPTAPGTTPTQKTFTMTELAQYNGQNGQPAYVAVDGVVYDVSGSAMWAGGVHSRCDEGATAGRDLSEVIKEAPPGHLEMLKTFPVVGTLAQ